MDSADYNNTKGKGHGSESEHGGWRWNMEGAGKKEMEKMMGLEYIYVKLKKKNLPIITTYYLRGSEHWDLLKGCKK